MPRKRPEPQAGSSTIITSVRLSRGIYRRMDALCEPLLDDPVLGARGKISRAEVMRAALLAGLDVLEERVKRFQGKATPS